MQPTYSTAHPRNECFFQMWRCFESFNSRREITLLHQTWLLAVTTSYYSSYYTLCMRFCHVPQIHCTHTTYFNVAAVTETALSYSTPQSLLSVYVFYMPFYSIYSFYFRGRLEGTTLKHLLSRYLGKVKERMVVCASNIVWRLKYFKCPITVPDYPFQHFQMQNSPQLWVRRRRNP